MIKECQDWKEVILKNPQKKEKLETKSVNVPKYMKIEKETENLKHEKFKNSKTLMNARVAANMNQKELAKKACIPLNVLQNYEKGNEIPDNKILQKLRGILKVKI